MNAHYTDASYVQAIWDAVTQLGFTGGSVLEPGCGSGNFLGFAPPGLRLVGVEVDPTTAEIARALYPHAEIRAESFADTWLPDPGFDLVIGNVPFGSHKLHDPRYNPGREHSIHNHFILKSLHATRPGGLVALITSRYTMDGVDPAHQHAREQMAGLADLVGAVRLPADAHQVAAGTEVVTDLLIFRRRPGEQSAATAPEWLPVRSVELPAARASVTADTFEVNEYFLEHPQMVLGEQVTDSGRNRPVLTVRASEADTAASLRAALDRLAPAPQVVLRAPEPQVQEGLFLDEGDGRFSQIRDGRRVRHEPARTQIGELRALIGLRETVLALLDEEAAHRDETPQMAALRGQLNTRYDGYVARFGAINRFQRSTGTRVDKDTGEVVETERRSYPRMGGFRDDPFFPYVAALEKFDDESGQVQKAEVFTQRVIAVPVPVHRTDSVEDALVVCWDRHNEVRLDVIASLLGLDDPQQAREALGELVFEEPGTAALIRKAEYLSGNVRRKLAAAQLAAEDDPRFEVNVQALRAVVPRDLTPAEISARLGSPWIDASYVQQFLREILEDDTVAVSNIGARWSVTGGDKKGVLAATVWGTKSRPATALADNLLNSQTIEITKTIKTESGERTVRDTEATAFAQAKAQQLDERFRAWLWEDPDRAATLGRTYNDRFNARVPRSYEGEHIEAPGMSAAFTLHPHQMAAIARIRNTPGVGLFHGTGAGKTLEMIVGGMELVRLGLVSKPCYVVPKGVLGQFRREFLQAYPRAKVLAADSEDLTGDKRRQFVARCSTGDWDAIIISHNAFKKIPVSRAVRVDYLNKQLERLRKHLANSADADRYTVKDIEKQVQNLEQQIADQLATPSDSGVEFERTGIGYLFIDEAHVYKNLRVISAIPELSHPGNQITADLDMKLAYLRRTGRRVVTLATATPIDNSPSEILTMTKYAAPELLAEMGVEEDDQYHAAFIQPRRRVEMRPDGSGFASRTRHTRYVNLPEQKQLMYSWADVKLKEHLDLGEPAIIGGQPEVLAVPASTQLHGHLVTLAGRAKQVTSGYPDQRWTSKGELKDDNILWISTDGRTASLDLRLIGDHTDEPQKIDVAADRIVEIWREHADDVYYGPDGTPEPVRGSLQLVFCDLGVPRRDRWSVYEGLRDELVARGMPAEQIRFAQDAKTRRQKDQLDADARDGKIAVLIGSRQGLGTGRNIQRRVITVLQLDPTWKLTPVTQSLGRGQRQGNDNPAIHHIFVVTENSYDPFLWQKVDDKARFTRQMLDPNDTTRVIDAQEEDNAGQIDPAVMFAVAAGRPELLELHPTEEAVGALRLEQRIWGDEQFTLTATVEQNRRTITGLRRSIAELDQVLARRRDTRGDAFRMTLDGSTFDGRADAGAALVRRLHAAVHADRGRQQLLLGELGGVTLSAGIEAGLLGDRALLRLDGISDSMIELTQRDLDTLATGSSQDQVGLIRKLENRLTGADDLRQRYTDSIDRLQANIDRATARIGLPFPRQADLDRYTDQLAELHQQLQILDDASPDQTPDSAAAPTAGQGASDQGTSRPAATEGRSATPAADDTRPSPDETDPVAATTRGPGSAGPMPPQLWTVTFTEPSDERPRTTLVTAKLVQQEIEASSREPGSRLDRDGDRTTVRDRDGTTSYTAAPADLPWRAWQPGEADHVDLGPGLVWHMRLTPDGRFTSTLGGPGDARRVLRQAQTDASPVAVTDWGVVTVHQHRPVAYVRQDATIPDVPQVPAATAEPAEADQILSTVVPAAATTVHEVLSQAGLPSDQQQRLIGQLQRLADEPHIQTAARATDYDRARLVFDEKLDELFVDAVDAADASDINGLASAVRYFDDDGGSHLHAFRELAGVELYQRARAAAEATTQPDQPHTSAESARHEDDARDADTDRLDRPVGATVQPGALPETQRRRRGHPFYPPADILATVPPLYGTDRQPAEDKMLYLHYFGGAHDIWLAEYDPVTGEGFGYINLGDPDNAEWGYVSLPEAEQVNHGLVIIERDLYWTPVPASQAKLPGWRAPRPAAAPTTAPSPAPATAPDVAELAEGPDPDPDGSVDQLAQQRSQQLRDLVAAATLARPDGWPEVPIDSALTITWFGQPAGALAHPPTSADRHAVETSAADAACDHALQAGAVAGNAHDFATDFPARLDLYLRQQLDSAALPHSRFWQDYLTDADLRTELLRAAADTAFAAIRANAHRAGLVAEPVAASPTPAAIATAPAVPRTRAAATPPVAAPSVAALHDAQHETQQASAADADQPVTQPPVTPPTGGPATVVATDTSDAAQLSDGKHAKTTPSRPPAATAAEPPDLTPTQRAAIDEVGKDRGEPWSIEREWRIRTFDRVSADDLAGLAADVRHALTADIEESLTSPAWRERATARRLLERWSGNPTALTEAQDRAVDALCMPASSYDMPDAARLGHYGRLTANEFLTLDAGYQQDIKADLKAIAESGATKTIPRNRSGIGATVRTAADHVSAARNLLQRLGSGLEIPPYHNNTANIGRTVMGLWLNPGDQVQLRKGPVTVDRVGIDLQVHLVGGGTLPDSTRRYRLIAAGPDPVTDNAAVRPTAPENPEQDPAPLPTAPAVPVTAATAAPPIADRTVAAVHDDAEQPAAVPPPAVAPPTGAAATAVATGTSDAAQPIAEQRLLNKVAARVPADVVQQADTPDGHPSVLLAFVANATYGQVTGVDLQRQPITARGYVIQARGLRGGYGGWHPDTVMLVELGELPDGPVVHTVQTDMHARLTVLDPPRPDMPAGESAPWLRMPVEQQILTARTALGMSVEVRDGPANELWTVQDCPEQLTGEVARWLFGGRYGSWEGRARPVFRPELVEQAVAAGRIPPQQQAAPTSSADPPDGEDIDARIARLRPYTEPGPQYRRAVAEALSYARMKMTGGLDPTGDLLEGEVSAGLRPRTDLAAWRTSPSPPTVAAPAPPVPPPAWLAGVVVGEETPAADGRHQVQRRTNRHGTTVYVQARHPQFGMLPRGRVDLASRSDGEHPAPRWQIFDQDGTPVGEHTGPYPEAEAQLLAATADLDEPVSDQDAAELTADPQDDPRSEAGPGDDIAALAALRTASAPDTPAAAPAPHPAADDNATASQPPAAVAAAVGVDAVAGGPPTTPSWSDRIQIVDGPSLVVRGTTGAPREEGLRGLLKQYRFRYQRAGGEWRYTGRPADRAAAIGDIRRWLAAQDRADAARARKSTVELPPTEQQQHIIDAYQAGHTIAVQALAGTGKTSTLQMLAATRPQTRVAYIAFNRSIADEAQRKFSRNVRADTSHAFAREALSSTPIRGKLARVGHGARWPEEWARHLHITVDVGQTPPEGVARMVVATVRNFRESAADTISREHLPGSVPDEVPGLAQAVLGYARTAWQDIADPDGQLLFDHDDYLKLWALGNPRLPYDVIFFDEAQDINDVLRKVIQDQPAQTIVVGDSNQSIYGFRGAIDALKNWPAQVTLPLTQSWRFGPAVAEVGNQFLRLLKSTWLLTGNPALDSSIGLVDDPDAILARTNAGAVAAVFDAFDNGKRVALMGGGRAIEEIAKAAKDLQAGRGTKHPDLSRFADWDEVRAYVEDGEDAQSLRAFVRLVDRRGADGLLHMVKELVNEDQTGPDGNPAYDIIVSTVHKAKGREWGQVRVADDFPKPQENQANRETVLPNDEQLRLAYVAVTRARHRLELGSLSWIGDFAEQAQAAWAHVAATAPSPPLVEHPSAATTPLVADRPSHPQTVDDGFESTSENRATASLPLGSTVEREPPAAEDAERSDEDEAWGWPGDTIQERQAARAAWAERDHGDDREDLFGSWAEHQESRHDQKSSGRAEDEPDHDVEPGSSEAEASAEITAQSEGSSDTTNGNTATPIGRAANHDARDLSGSISSSLQTWLSTQPFTADTPADQRQWLAQHVAELVDDRRVRLAALANNEDDFGRVFEPALEDHLMDASNADPNNPAALLYFRSDDFAGALNAYARHTVYQAVQNRPANADPATAQNPADVAQADPAAAAAGREHTTRSDPLNPRNAAQLARLDSAAGVSNRPVSQVGRTIHPATEAAPARRAPGM